ncbi:RHS repeat-associated core domain-containing protein [Paracidovorax valerianellae]|uniref:RHS repeat-associated core domain-containing protein n=1 Tax=Paracidovorax valerianellae TaxID=187868 RepID=A0A1G6Z8Z6_9BURK|nr:RHS repeat-associated core domain-containing protein [Paracidovorax valerianellae]
MFKSDARLSGSSNPAITTQTVYAEDGIDSTVLGQYGNRRSSNSAAPAGEMDSTEVIYLPTASGPMPVAAQINGRLYAIDADHLNTPRRLTNTQGQVAWQWLITGFGEANPTTGATGYSQSGQGSANYSEAIKFDLRYPGQVWDEETQLAYNLNRYYDREGGRYIQADPIGLDGGWNRYLYADGTPTNLIDPSGLASFMPGGGFGDSPLVDNGSSCSPIFQQPRVDDGGCISTGGGTNICIGPGSIRGVLPRSAAKIDPVVIREIEQIVRSGGSAFPLEAGAQLRAVAESFAGKIRNAGTAAQATHIRDVGLGAIDRLDRFDALTPAARQQLREIINGAFRP